MRRYNLLDDAMSGRIRRPLAIAAFVCCCLAGVQALAQNAYIANSRNSRTVSVIDTATNTVIGHRSPSASTRSAWR